MLPSAISKISVGKATTMACSKLSDLKKRKADGENRLFKYDWTDICIYSSQQKHQTLIYTWDSGGY